MDTTTQRRATAVRRVGWLAVASMLALAALAPSATSAAKNTTSYHGAIWTSLANGATVNANIYTAKSDVYLNGGPQNCGNGNGLPEGEDFYFQVTDPSGATLLSTDAIKFRQVHVDANGDIAGVSGSGNHVLGTSGCNTGLPVQLMPFSDTPNNGGEYSVDLAKKADVQACQGFDENLPFNFLSCTNTKNDNFKVRLQAPAIAIVKVADPTSLPFGGGEVTYTYTVTNIGDVPLSNVTVTDDKCGSGEPVAYVNGDANHDERLDLDETWTFDCTTAITVTTVNTAIAEGWWDGAPVTAQAQATVTVLPPTAPPTASPTPTFQQSVGGETGTPKVTLPPTAAMDPATGGSDGWRMALIALAALLSGALVMTPAQATVRRR